MKTLKTMKIKYLLAALTGVALVSCSQDDLNLEQPQVEAKSPISFVVHSDIATRAELNGAQVTFEAGDLMSLYQNGTIGGVDPKNFTSYGNAIFEGKGDGGSGLEFTSRNMVEAGYAIMVYPADTVPTWADNKTTGLAVSIPADQPAGYADFIPQVSDFMNIGGYTNIEDNNTEGYGRKYDIRLKPLGTLVRLTLNAKNKDAFDNLEGVDPIEFTGVEFKSDADAFYTKVVLKDNGTPSTLKDDAINEDYETYAHFLNQVDVDFDNSTKSTSISTEDIRNGNMAYLVMLPSNATTDNPSIVVKTTYGTVEVKQASGEEVITSSSSKWTVKDGLDYILDNSWKEITTKGNKFFGAKAGVSAQRGLTFDLKTLQIDGTVIKTSKQLIDLTKVYKALGKTENVTLVLKADKEEFILTDEAMNAMVGVKNFKLDASTNANKIVIEGGASLDLLNKAEVAFTGKIDLVLRNTWTIDQKESFAKVNSLTNQGILTVTNKTNLLDTNAFGIDLTVAKTAVLNTSGKVYMGAVTALETSVINIPAGGNEAFYATGKTMLFGTVNNSGVLSSRTTDGILNFGTINCIGIGEVSVVQGVSGAKFDNAGIINAAESSVVYITNNEITVSGDAPAIDGTYKGAIVLAKRNGEVTVKEAESTPGYIKYTAEATADKLEVKKVAGDKFNYLIVDVKYSPLSTVSLDKEVVSTLKYLEIKGNTAQVTSTDAFTVTDLIVQSNMRYLSGNGKLTATNTWVKGSILHAFTITPGNINNGDYLSGIYGVKADKGFTGEVRTTGN